MDLLSLLVAQVNGTVEQVANATDAVKPKSTTGGMMTAYVSLIVMALIPILVGAFKSVEHHLNQKKRSRVSPSVISSGINSLLTRTRVRRQRQ